MAHQPSYSMVKIIRKIESKLNQLDRNFCRQKVIFLHIPKCGGTSIGTAIASSVNASTKGFIDPIQTREIAREISNQLPEGSQFLMQLRQAMLLQYYMRDEPYIFGHFPIVRKILEEPKDYLVVTVLREPVARFISQFKYYLATRFTNQLTDNKILNQEEINDLWQTYINSSLAIFHANTLSAYLNHDRNLGIGTKEASDQAIDNLDFFHLVGFLDQLNTFTNQFSQISGNKIIIPSKNRTQDKISHQQNKIFQDVLDHEKYLIAEKMCYHDLKIYNHVLNRQKS